MSAAALLEDWRQVYEGPGLVALVKPVGLLTVPGRSAEAPSLWRLAEAVRGERLWAVHRLDRETSGLVIFARTATAHRQLSLAFEHRQVEKHYLAWVSPAPVLGQGSLRHRLTSARRGFMRLAAEGEGGVAAETDYRVLAAGVGGALLELQPRTGRTHQLRLQLAALGTPIVGDPHYRVPGGPPAAAAARLWLHAWTLRLREPGGNAWLDLSASPPPELDPVQFNGSAT